MMTSANMEHLAAEHARAQERAARMRLEAMTCGCLPECVITEFPLLSHGLVKFLHTSGVYLHSYEYECVMRHWTEQTVLPAEVLDWLRSLHPVSDTVSSTSEPEVWAIMRGEA